MQQLKEDQIIFRIKQSIVEKVSGRTKPKFCPLFLAVKIHFIKDFNDNQLLNKRNGFIVGRRDPVKLWLQSFKRK